jgi:hypothetical protein
MLKRSIVLVLMCVTISFAFAQNEAARDFLNGTSLVRQAGYSIDRFPKMEIGFVGRKPSGGGDNLAYLFIRFQTTTDVGGGILGAVSLLEETQKNAIDGFVQLLATFYVSAKRADEGNLLLDKDIGILELRDFQWYMVENQWKHPYNFIFRINVKMQTVNGEHRLYFYRTSSIKDVGNEFYTFTVPNDTYMTVQQCFDFVTGATTQNSFYYKAIQTAIDAANRTVR